MKKHLLLVMEYVTLYELATKKQLIQLLFLNDNFDLHAL